MLDAEAARAVMAGLRDALLGMASRGGIVFGLALLGTLIGRSLGPERRHTVWLVVILLLAALPAARLATPLIHVPLLDPPAPAGPADTVVVPIPPPAAVELDPARQQSAVMESASRHDGRPGGMELDARPEGWVLLVLAATWCAGALVAAGRPLTGRLCLRRILRSP